MSRTRRGSKGAGFEFWSRRPVNGWGDFVFMKRQTHKIERKESSAAIEEQLDEQKQEPMFTCSRCGSVCCESDRSGDSTECMYC